MNRVLSAIPAPACLLDVEGRVTATNERFASLVGAPDGDRSDDPAGPTVEGVDPESLPADGSTVTRDLTIRGGTGSVDARGDLCLVDDCRPRDAALCVLPSLEDRSRDLVPEPVRSVVEDLPVGAFVLRDDGSVGVWNARMEELLDWSKSDTLGERPPFVPEAAGDAWQSIRERVYGGEIVRERDLRLRTAEGATRTLRITAGPIRDGGRIRGLLALVSETVAGERRKRQLELLDRVLRHNVRNDMNLVEGNAELLRQELSDPDLLELCDGIAEASRSILALSEKARTLKQVTGPVTRVEPLPVTDIVADVVERYRKQYPEADIEFGAGLSVTGRASPLLEVAVENLLENAIVHNDGEPHVEVSVDVTWTAGSEAVEVVVADDGPQIPEQERQVLADEHEDVLQHGSGIGLWLVYWITKESGGELVYEPRDPRGNELTIRVPRGVPGPG